MCHQEQRLEKEELERAKLKERKSQEATGADGLRCLSAPDVFENLE